MHYFDYVFYGVKCMKIRYINKSDSSEAAAICYLYLFFRFIRRRGCLFLVFAVTFAVRCIRCLLGRGFVGIFVFLADVCGLNVFRCRAVLKHTRVLGKNLVCTALPWTFAEYVYNILRENNFTCYENFSELVVAFGVFA